MSRLIDADALKKLRRCEIDEYADGWTFKELWEEEEADIDSLPTIDPVKHGKWEMLMGWPFPEWRCSQCGNHICGDKEHLKKWNYCPNCGALMREGGEEG